MYPNIRRPCMQDESLSELVILWKIPVQNKSNFMHNNKVTHHFDIRKSVHRHMIQINQPTRCNSFTSLLLDVYVWLNMFWAPLRPSSGAYNCARRLWFYRWSVAVGALLVVETTTNSVPTATLQR